MASPKTFTLRGASQYLATKDVDVSELRMRTLVNQHEIFKNDTDTAKLPNGDTASLVWRVSQKALDNYVKAAKAGDIRTSTGAKAYKVNLTTEQLEQLRSFCASHGIAEPVRANKTYTKKGKPATNGAVGSDIEQAFDDGDESEDMFEDETEEAVEA